MDLSLLNFVTISIFCFFIFGFLINATNFNLARSLKDFENISTVI